MGPPSTGGRRPLVSGRPDRGGDSFPPPGVTHHGLAAPRRCGQARSEAGRHVRVVTTSSRVGGAPTPGAPRNPPTPGGSRDPTPHLSLGASQHGGGEEGPLGLMRGGASVSGADRAELGSRQLGPRAR